MTSRRFTMLLAASLLTNIFAAGALGGGLLMLSWHGGLRQHVGALHRPIAAAGTALPPPDRGRFAHLMRQIMRDNRDFARTARMNRETAAELFVQPQFDADAVNAALQRARDADMALRARLEAAAVGFAATLPVEERTILSNGLSHGGPLRHPSHRAASSQK